MRKPITVILPFVDHTLWNDNLTGFLSSPHVEEVIILHKGECSIKMERVRLLEAANMYAGSTLNQLINEVRTNFFILFTFPGIVIPGQNYCERLLQMESVSNPAILYAEYVEQTEKETTYHPVLDYHAGSVRDEFNFGPFMCFSTSAVRKTLVLYGPIPDVKVAGLYDLRLKLSITEKFNHIPEPLCTVKMNLSGRQDSESQFDYVDPKNRTAQVEYEQVFTDHLKRIGSFLEPEFSEIHETQQEFPVDMSIVIPVFNREETIGDAIKSALTQVGKISFNVLIINNHSTDNTSIVIDQFIQHDNRVHQLIPQRTDLGIGGCWNEALFSPLCGRYIVQLDSDDLYAHENVLQNIYDEFQRDAYAMVVGSYTLVNYDLEKIPPGIIDHREWTPENGRNNVLRINGLGAPRAFRTEIVRKTRFPNVSYGEDYAVELTLSRHYRIGRIYDSLYFCRRWEGNSDALLSVSKQNQNDYYKDYLRGIEIASRQRLNK